MKERGFGWGILSVLAIDVFAWAIVMRVVSIHSVDVQRGPDATGIAALPWAEYPILFALIFAALAAAIAGLAGRRRFMLGVIVGLCLSALIWPGQCLMASMTAYHGF